MAELKHPDVIEKGRVRAVGGGRKQSIDSIPGLHKNFLEVLWDYTAGDPMDEQIRWTDLTCWQIVDKLKEKGIDVSGKIVKQLFKKHGYKKRKAWKTISTGTSNDRNEQFENIAELKAIYIAAGNPIISIDTKKKELSGNLYRDGRVYTVEVQKVFDHDFPHLSDGVIIPHGIYDLNVSWNFIYFIKSHANQAFTSSHRRKSLAYLIFIAIYAVKLCQESIPFGTKIA